MSSEKVHDGTIWSHKKEGYSVRVEHSAPHGETSFRRVIPLPSEKGPISRLRNKQTHYFLGEFTKAEH